MNKDEIIESQKKEIRKLKTRLKYAKKASLRASGDRNSIIVRCIEKDNKISSLISEINRYVRLQSKDNKEITEYKEELDITKKKLEAANVILEARSSVIEEMKRNVNVRRAEVIRRELNYYQQDLGRVKSKLLQAKNEVEKLKIRNFKLIGYLELAIKRIAHYMGKTSKYEQETHWNNFKNKNFINQ